MRHKQRVDQHDFFVESPLDLLRSFSIAVRKALYLGERNLGS